MYYYDRIREIVLVITKSKYFLTIGREIRTQFRVFRVYDHNDTFVLILANIKMNFKIYSPKKQIVV